MSVTQRKGHMRAQRGGHSEEVAIRTPRREDSGEVTPASTSIPGLWLLELRKRKFLVFTCLSLQYFFMAKWVIENLFFFFCTMGYYASIDYEICLYTWKIFII